MSKFIRLTQLTNNRKLLVNVADISFINEGSGESPSVIFLSSSEAHTHVKESGQYIRNRLKELECVIS